MFFSELGGKRLSTRPGELKLSDISWRSSINIPDLLEAFVGLNLFFVFLVDVNERPSQVTLDGNTVKENEVGGFVGKVTVSDPDIGQNHKCDVYDLVVDSATSTESLKGSRFFTVDDSFNLTTYNSLNFEEAHTVDIIINCSDVVSPPQRRLFKTTLFTITVKGMRSSLSGSIDSELFVMHQH